MTGAAAVRAGWAALLTALLAVLAGCAEGPAAAPAAGTERPRWLAAEPAPDQPTPRLRILLTNDDGWEAPGLAAVRDALVRAGHQVTVVAPAGNQSGTSAALTVGGTLSVTRPTGDPAVVAVSGSPADATLVGLTTVLGGIRPDLVVSGTNTGANVGLLANHSGTVGAAVTGTEFGVPSIAVSTDVPTDRPPTPTDFTATADFTARLVAELARGRVGQPLLPPAVLLNINYPRTVPGRPAPVARYVRSAADMAISVRYQPGPDPTRYSVAMGRGEQPPAPDGDVGVVAAGDVAITELHADRTSNGAPPTVAADLVARLNP